MFESVPAFFDHHEVVVDNRIGHRSHSLDLATEARQLLAELRLYFKSIAGAV